MWFLIGCFLWGVDSAKRKISRGKIGCHEFNSVGNG